MPSPKPSLTTSQSEPPGPPSPSKKGNVLREASLTVIRCESVGIQANSMHSMLCPSIACLSATASAWCRSRTTITRCIVRLTSRRTQPRTPGSIPVAENKSPVLCKSRTKPPLSVPILRWLGGLQYCPVVGVAAIGRELQISFPEDASHDGFLSQSQSHTVGRSTACLLVACPYCFAINTAVACMKYPSYMGGFLKS